MYKLNYIERLKDKLHATDYIAIKSFEGYDVSEYGDWLGERRQIREEINTVQNMTDEEFEEYQNNSLIII